MLKNENFFNSKCTDECGYEYMQMVMLYLKGFLPGATMPPTPLMMSTMMSTPLPNFQLKEVGRVRSVFPETWLWTNRSTGYSNDNRRYSHICNKTQNT